MPTYEYQCNEGHEFEVFQKISDRPRAKCPTCGARAKRVISGGAGLIFKGSGFYITDYGKDGKGPRKDGEKAESGGAPKSESGSDGSAGKDGGAQPKSEKSEKKAKKAPKADS